MVLTICAASKGYGPGHLSLELARVLLWPGSLHGQQDHHLLVLRIASNTSGSRDSHVAAGTALLQ